MKYFKILLVCVIVAAITFFIYKPKVSESPVKSGEDVAVKSLDGEYCFHKELNRDVTDVTLSISGSDVTGRMDWVPFEKDSGRGTLSGKLLENGEMDLMYKYVIEGAHQTETKIMKIENGKLYIKHGELLDPKYNGNLVYRDAASAVYNEVIDPCVK